MAQGYCGGFVFLAMCLGLASHLQAFSVGDIAVQSAAKEPFHAEIRFVLEAHERDREFEVLLGTAQDYQLEDLDRPSVLQHMHIVLAPDKQDTVRIFSNVPIMDETFDLLVLLRSGKLTIVRNYRVELQESVTPEQQKAVVEPAVPPIPTEPVSPQPQLAPSAARSAVSKAELAPTPPPIQAIVDSANTYGPIQRGETMYSIVGKLDVPSDRRWQAVVLLWRANHGAFLRGNLHGLLVGAHLEVPVDLEVRLRTVDQETSQQIIASQWEAWRKRQLTTAAEALAMTSNLKAVEAQPMQEVAGEPSDEQLGRLDTTTIAGTTDSASQEPRSEEGPVAIATPESAEAVDPAEARSAVAESDVDGSTANTELPQPPVEPPARDMASLPEEPAHEDSVAAIAPPQVMRLPTEEGSSFVSTQELKLLLGNLENRLLRRLAPVQEVQDRSSFVSPTELHVSLQDLENRLTQRVEQILARGRTQVSPEPTAQPRPTSIPPAGLEFIAGIRMPPVAYLLVLINVILLVISLTLGWRWWRQSSGGGA